MKSVASRISSNEMIQLGMKKTVLSVILELYSTSDMIRVALEESD